MRDLLEGKSDPGRKYTAPYMSGMVGIAYNRAATGRDIKIDDMWDPAFMQRSACSPDTQDGLGMFMLAQATPEDPTLETVQKAVDVIKEQKDTDPPVHRQRLRRRPCGRQYHCRPGIFGRWVAASKITPDLQFVVPGFRSTSSWTPW